MSRKLYVLAILAMAGLAPSETAVARVRNYSTHNYQITTTRKQVSIRPKVSAYPNANKVYHFPKKGKPSVTRWR